MKIKRRVGESYFYKGYELFFFENGVDVSFNTVWLTDVKTEEEAIAFVDALTE